MAYIYGSDIDDVLVGTAEFDDIVGYGGSDQLYGGDGDDDLDGGTDVLAHGHFAGKQVDGSAEVFRADGGR